MIAWTLLAALAALPSEAQVLRVVQEDFERTGRSAPLADLALRRAAGLVAARALTAGAEDAAGLVRVTAALSTHGGWDPSPITIVLRGGPEQLLEALAHSEAMSREPASLVGVGVAGDGDRAALAVLLARRRVDLEAFPRRLRAPAGSPHRLCGTLREPLTSAEVFVTRPLGEVDRLPMSGRAGPRLCAEVGFPSPGRHTVEVLASGPRGPEVAALFFVDVGPSDGAEDASLAPEPTTDAEARAELLTRINALRSRLGAGALAPDRALDAVAQAWADRLGHENFFSHVAPDGSDLKARLRAAGYHFASAGENLGLASGPLSAHFGIEHSPGHRRNLLDKEHQRLGIGLARRADGKAVLVEVLARPADPHAEPSRDPLADAYGALQAERRRHGLRPLTPHPVLEALAQGHARAALELRLPKTQLPGRAKLHDQVFDAVDSARTVSVDIFIADNPRAIVESKSLVGPQTALVGVGVALASSPEKGSARYWIVVIYSSVERGGSRSP